MSNRNPSFGPRRLALDGVLVALFFGLSMLSVEVAGVKITFSGLATLMGAILFGPIDGFLIGLLGAFTEQMMKYGMSSTTVLWILPPALRGLTVGLCLLKSRFALMQGKGLAWAMTACMLSGLLVSVGNTFAFYVDAKLFHYYSYALIFGVFWVRVALGLGSSLAMGLVTVPIIRALGKAGFVPGERK